VGAHQRGGGEVVPAHPAVADDEQTDGGVAGRFIPGHGPTHRLLVATGPLRAESVPGDFGHVLRVADGAVRAARRTRYG
jgi:hypothetical protein